MRRLINLNQLGMLFVKIISVFIMMIPAILYGLLLLAGGTGIVRPLLLILIKVSFVIGTVVFVVFLMLIVVEQVQDHYLDVQYRKQRGQKLVLVNGKYECQYCGNQRVQANDKICRVCGREFTLGRRK